MNKVAQFLNNIIQHLLANKNFYPFLIIFLSALLLTAPNLNKDGIPYGSGSNDTTFQMIRMSGTSVRGLEDGQLVPQVDPGANNGLGDAINLFYGPLLTYILPLLRIATFSWENAYIVLIFLAFLLSGIFLYKFAYTVSQKRPLATLASVLYMTMPYFISDVFIRGAWGEVPTFIFMPILFMGIYNLLHDRKWAVTQIWVGATGIILDHMLSIVVVMPFALLYFILNWKLINLAKIKKVLLAIIITAGLSAFFWMPLLEAKHTGLYNIFNFPYLDSIPSNGATEVKNNGLALTQYLFSDPALGVNGVTQYNLSIIVLLGLVLLLFARKTLLPKTERRMIVQLLTIAALATIISLRVFPWEFVPTRLLSIQFPWRFCMITCFAVSILSAYGLYYGLISKFPKKYTREGIIAATAFVVLLTMPLLSAIYYSYPHTTFASLSTNPYFTEPLIMEYLPVVPCDKLNDKSTCSWDILQKNEILKPKVISGTAKLSNYSQKGTLYTVSINDAAAGTVIRIPAMYYPGYRAYLKSDNSKLDLKVSYSKEYGLVQITVPNNGSFTLFVKYHNTTITYIGLSITVATVIALFCYCAVRFALKKKRIKNGTLLS